MHQLSPRLHQPSWVDQLTELYGMSHGEQVLLTNGLPDLSMGLASKGGFTMSYCHEHVCCPDLSSFQGVLKPLHEACLAMQDPLCHTVCVVAQGVLGHLPTSAAALLCMLMHLCVGAQIGLSLQNHLIASTTTANTMLCGRHKALTLEMK